MQLVARGFFSDCVARNVTQDVVWTSSNTDVAVVSPAGNVTVLQAGDVIIYCFYNPVIVQDGTTGQISNTTTVYNNVVYNPLSFWSLASYIVLKVAG